MKPTKLLVIDDHSLFRSGLRVVLNASMPEAEVLEAGSINEAMQFAADKLDAILLDIKLPGLNGLEGIAMLKRKWQHTPVVVLSSQDEPESVRLSIARGAARFVSKAETADNIIAVLKQAIRGELPAQQLDPVIGQAAGSPSHLTPRQCEVLDLLCQGMSNKLIARKLFLSEHTVRGHVQAILAFLQVSSRSEAAFAARRRGLVN